MSDSELIIGERLIQELWMSELCPIANGVIYGNGEMVLFDFNRQSKAGELTVSLRPVLKIHIASFLEENPDYWTSITTLNEALCEEKNINVSAGEGGMGGDGFVALTTLNDNYLKWILFFENSNPFIEVAISGSDILAITNLKERWTIPINSPETMSVLTPSTIE